MMLLAPIHGQRCSSLATTRRALQSGSPWTGLRYVLNSLVTLVLRRTVTRPEPGRRLLPMESGRGGSTGGESQRCLSLLLAASPDRACPLFAVHPKLWARFPPPHCPLQERGPQRHSAHLPVPRRLQAPHQHEVQPAALPTTALGDWRVGRGRDNPFRGVIEGEDSASSAPQILVQEASTCQQNPVWPPRLRGDGLCPPAWFSRPP